MFFIVIITASATDNILNIFETIPPAATEFPSTANNCQDKFINKCSPIGHQRLKFHFTYIQLKYNPPKKKMLLQKPLGKKLNHDPDKDEESRTILTV